MALWPMAFEIDNLDHTMRWSSEFKRPYWVRTLLVATTSLINRPSRFQSRVISPPSWPRTVALARRLPKPKLSGSRSITGPFLSLHTIVNRSSLSLQEISRNPLGEERAPYFAALVANSCNSRAKLVTVLPAIKMSGPVTEARDWQLSSPPA